MHGVLFAHIGNPDMSFVALENTEHQPVCRDREFI